MMTSSKTRTLFRITVAALGTVALAGLISTASAKPEAKESQTMSLQEAKDQLPNEWRWQKTPVNLDGMIRNR